MEKQKMLYTLVKTSLNEKTVDQSFEYQGS